MSKGTVINEAHGSLILREREPVNLEYPFDRLDEVFTPNEMFYVRSHFKAPRIERANYTLSIGGAVEQPFSISYQDLIAMPSVTKSRTLECAGNSRIFLVPQVKGAQWQQGAVGTATWTGVPLADLLKRAGVNVDCCEIVLEGADRGVTKNEPTPPGDTQYARSIAIEKAADVLIVYKMNGDDLALDHGAPVRAIVAGHYGMASVKWLTHIYAVTQPFLGYWQTSDYGYWDYENGIPVRRALGPMALKSAIARPQLRECIPAGQIYKVFGAAWSGEACVCRVEFTTDAGAHWSPVRLLDKPEPFVWCRWDFDWHVPARKGIYVLQSRATDLHGKTQPAEHDKRYGTYVINHTLEIEVTVC